MIADLGLDLVVVFAFVLLVGGVVGSVLPGLPGSLLSLLGVYVYWWQSGYSEPGLLVLVALTLVALFTMAADFLSTVVAARTGGASRLSAIVAGIVGFVLLFVTGPLGMLAGMGATVFVLEFRRHEDVRGGLVAALSAVAGAIASAAVQLLLTASILVVMAFVAVF